MGKFRLTSAALAMALTASSCTATISGIGSFIDQVIAATQKGCKFVPAVDTIVKLVAMFGGPNAESIVVVADKICSVAKNKDGSLKALPPGSVFGYVDGVPVKSAPPEEIVRKP